ncbi:molybdopterin-guanine dinucleotide biosynthesis protein A [Pararhizobium capsulatum DSM 1112]|uniref:Molybdenum cofactor guanylyltransferase n=1 Tax=Pararhizobium capsulatum DSM 1112 TaxID=1121113 RepID=A0ABU0BUR9_9HYPH|nr:molybdenum cofactor guanylyltransferase MobA [Pararhizobium capsulatum]MDQ0320587.1 molybdopterin-guanine dinucleotide biosynthesis protein A [Pararhizobium capsulatum DSM 1112]
MQEETSLIKPPGFILAGGLSSRMGSPKALAILGGETLLARAANRLAPQVSALHLNWNGPIPAEGLCGFSPVPDEIGGHAGPLAGILTAMRHIARIDPATSHVVTVPIDAPFFPLDLVARLKAAIRSEEDIAIAFSEGNMHPVFGLWPVVIADDLENFLGNDDKRRVRAFIARHPMIAVNFDPPEETDSPLRPFLNLNTPEELAWAGQMLPNQG